MNGGVGVCWDPLQPLILGKGQIAFLLSEEGLDK